MRCPVCPEENDDDAAFCDQCGASLTARAEAAAPEPDDDNRCPDCGGKVEEIAPGKGKCRKCGAELAEQAPEGDDATAVLAPATVLTRMILQKIKQDLPVEDAVEAACAEFFGERGRTGPRTPCPVCAQENPEDAERCAGCAIAFSDEAEAFPCPRCGTRRSGDKCPCGAILTLSYLLQFVDPTVASVCARCKGLFTKGKTTCPECGVPLLSAEGLKKSAAGR